MDRCRYIVARVVPDIGRNEPINVGIVLQSDEKIAAKFVSSLPKSVIPDNHLRGYVRSLQALWEERLTRDADEIFLPGWDRPQITRQTSEDFLWWLHKAYGTFLRFSEPRSVETESLDDVRFSIIMDELFDVLVSRRKPRRGVKVTATFPKQTRAQVNQQVEQTFERVGIRERLTSDAEVSGEIVRRWRFDWAHLNKTTGVLIDTIWLGYEAAEQNLKQAAYVSTKARDVSKVGKYDIHGILYSPNGLDDRSVRESRALLEAEGIILEDFITVDELATRLAAELL